MDVHCISEEDFHHYAYNDKKELICLSKDDGKITRIDYECIACREAVRPVMGDNREWHFRHKTENPNCNTESYLHQLAKKIIKYRFDNNSVFNISYYVEEKCSHFKHCPKHSELCVKEHLETINLKDYYDICEPEKKESHFPFRADLKLSSSFSPKHKPIFIEIAYTHDCDPQKIESGIQIIELKVNDDKDIDRSLVEEPIEESMMLDYTSGNPYLNRLPMVRFFNFERQFISDKIVKEPNCNRYWKAKDKLRKKYLQSDSYIIKYNGFKNCSLLNSCPLACDACQKQNITIKEDLKCIYDTCTEDQNGNFVLVNSHIDIPSITFKFSFGGKADYEEDKRVIEFLYYKDVEKSLIEDLMHVDLGRLKNPYKSQVQPSVRFYNFDREKEEECTISLKRFAVVKDGEQITCRFLDDVDCHHLYEWPENVLYGLLTPTFIDINFEIYAMIKACLNGYKIYHCSFCKHCHCNPGGCVRYGNYMYNLLEISEIYKVEECKKCTNYVINFNLLQQVIDRHKIPLFEWKSTTVGSGPIVQKV